MPTNPAPDGRTQFNLQFPKHEQYLRAREMVAEARHLVERDVFAQTGIRLKISNPAIVLAALEEFVKVRKEPVLD